MMPVQSFVAQPSALSTPLRSSAVSMSLTPMDRRAVLSGAATAMLWGVQAANAALATDKAELSAEEAKLKSEDNALIALDSKEMTDEIALKKAQDAVLSAMQKGDDKLVKELEAKVKALEGTAAADAKAKKALLAEVSKEADLVMPTRPRSPRTWLLTRRRRTRRSSRTRS